VQDLLKKIEAAAAARLPLVPDATPAETLARYKNFLKVETHRLKLWHRGGAGGREVCQARAAILDALLRHLWMAACDGRRAKGSDAIPPVALVATGGFGRAELNPHSDIDFMFLHDGQVGVGRPLPYLSALIDGVLYPLWDIGLKVGYSVRDIADCVKVANTDMQSKTSLIESRLIIGDEALFANYQQTVINKCVTGFEQKYIAMRLEDQASRRSKHGNSACMQEPNIKNGCGGLRDFQSLMWMVFFKYRARTPAELQAREFVGAAERKQLDAAYDFLLRVRTELHYHTNRPQDVLGKNLQPAVALNLGYGERSPSRRIELFMRDLYVHMRNIFLITRTLEQRLALVSPAETGRLVKLRRRLLGGSPARTMPEPVDGFLFVGDEVRAASNRIFRDSPRRLMRVFLHAQQRRLRLHPDLAQLIRNQLHLVDRDFLNDEHVRETFLTILEGRGAVAPALRSMHEVNLLGKYIPEFGRLTCLVQHEFYHQYAADEHTLVCIEQLDKIWEAKEPPYKHYAPLFQSLERPGLLYLALLLHDVGKAADHEQGRHAEAGAALAVRAARRLQLEAAATDTLQFLVENHLLMAILSQRRDLDDGAVIREFARKVGTSEKLNLLTLLTFSDAQGTSDKLWSGFKDSLLWQLHSRALALLTGGTEFRRASVRARDELRDAVRELASRRISDEELAAHFSLLPDRYYEIYTPKQILDDVEIAHRFMHRLLLESQRVLAPITAWIDERDRGYSLVKICTWDRAGLFVKIAGSLSAAGLNIMGAQIFTRADGIVLDTFFVNDGRTGGLAAREQREKFSSLLEAVLMGENINLGKLISQQATVRPTYTAYLGERMSTQIHFDNPPSDDRTLVEIETEDRLGLLHAISQTFAEQRLDISTARISTERGAALDSFYVREIGRGRITAPARLAELEKALREAISGLETAAV
jgi:[protein-PII] uridylyltransferase